MSGMRCAGLLSLCLSLAACAPGGPGGQEQGGAAGGGNGNGTDQAALQAEIERLFPYSASDPIDVIYYCLRSNSQLEYYFHLQPSGRFDVYSTTDTGQDFTFDGVYSLHNGVLHLQSASPILPLDESSTEFGTALGMLYRFTTPGMQCIGYGHGYNSAESYAHYRCPDINQGPASSESNALEIAHFSMPFNLQVPGAIFRQRDTYVNGMLNPIVRRGYGVYRRLGDAWYAYFPLNQFDDFEYLSGSLGGAGQVLHVEQFAVDCSV